MSETNYHSVVGEALSALIDGLTPFIEDVLAKAQPPIVSWTELLRRKDAGAGAEATVVCQSARRCLHRIAEWVSAFGAMMEW